MKAFERAAMWAWATVALAAMAFAAGQNLPAGDGKEIVEKRCTACHDATPIVEKKGTKETWTETVKNMQAYGLTINDADFAKVVDYLSKNFSADGAPAAGGTTSAADKEGLPAGEGRELVAVECMTCHDLMNVKAQKLTKDEWKDVVNNMVSYGAKLNDAQVTSVTDYLAKAYPK